MTATMLLCLPSTHVNAVEPEPLDVDFLDYLASCEGKEDNWTVVARPKRDTKESGKEAVQPKSPAPEAATPKEKQP